MAIVSAGIDLAKNVFTVHGVDESGKPHNFNHPIPTGDGFDRPIRPVRCLCITLLTCNERLD